MNKNKGNRDVDVVMMSVLRTEMSNRRTLLAYVKTALGIGGVGAGLLKFADVSSIYDDIGMVMIPVSLIVFIVGVFDFAITRKKIENEKREVKQ